MNCIVNVSEDWGIGRENQLLVAISADLRRFRSLTTGKTVILGRKTLSTFPGGRPLKNRVNLVLSSDRALRIEGAAVVHDLDELLAECRTYPSESLCVIGGASIYSLLLPYCDTAYITKTHLQTGADRFFPNLDALENWRIVSRSGVLEENGVYFEYLDYQNNAPLPL